MFEAKSLSNPSSARDFAIEGFPNGFSSDVQIPQKPSFARDLEGFMKDFASHV